MQEEKVRISRMLGMVQDEALIQRVLEFAMTVSTYTVQQIRKDNRDNLRIIFHIPAYKHIL